MLYILRLAASTLQHAINATFHFLTGQYFAPISNPSLESRTMKNIVILGGGFAGVSAAHRILKQAGKTAPFKVTLVSPNTHFYWNIALPRALVPGLLADDKIFQSIAAGFSQYPASQFEFIVASAKSLDIEAQQVGITNSTGDQTLNFDYLILATGSSTKGGTPFKTIGSTEATKDALHTFQARVKQSKTIVLAGAGPTGVEIAGELAFEYGRQKEVILIATKPTILEAAIPSVSKNATRLLQNLGVKIKLQTKVVSSAPTSDNRQELTLSDGSKLLTDMYIPTFGVVPNSSYISREYLNADKFVIVDDHLKVKGAEGVWAIGDVSDHEPTQFLVADKQAAYLAKSITLILSNKAPPPYKLAASGMGLLVGRKAGTGHLGSIKLPGFLVSMLRKNLFIDNLGPTVNGSAF